MGTQDEKESALGEYYKDASVCIRNYIHSNIKTDKSQPHKIKIHDTRHGFYYFQIIAVSVRRKIHLFALALSQYLYFHLVIVLLPGLLSRSYHF